MNPLTSNSNKKQSATTSKKATSKSFNPKPTKRTLKGTFGHLNSRINDKFFSSINRTISNESSDIRRCNEEIDIDIDDNADVEFNSSTSGTDKLKDSGCADVEASFSSVEVECPTSSAAAAAAVTEGPNRQDHLKDNKNSPEKEELLHTSNRSNGFVYDFEDIDGVELEDDELPSGMVDIEGTLIDKVHVKFGIEDDDYDYDNDDDEQDHNDSMVYHFQPKSSSSSTNKSTNNKTNEVKRKLQESSVSSPPPALELPLSPSKKHLLFQTSSLSSPPSSSSNSPSSSKYKILPKFITKTKSESLEKDPALLLSPKNIEFKNPYAYTNIRGFGTNEFRRHVGGGTKMSNNNNGNSILRKGTTTNNNASNSRTGQSENNNNSRKDSTGGATTIISSNTTITQHYYPEGGWGYVILFTAFITHVLLYGFLLSSGIVILNVIQLFHYHGTKEKINVLHAVWIGTLSTGISLFLSPIWIAICKRKSTRLAAIFGALVASLGCLFTSFASQFHQVLFSYATFIGAGVGVTRDASSLMVGQYFKRKREQVEMILVSASGIGILTMSAFLHFGISSLGWRLGLQAITGTLFFTFLLSSCYRSASLYHPQRRAILHLKNQKRKIKEKEKRDDKPPFLDFTCLRSKTLQILIISTAFTSFGIYTPLFYLAVYCDEMEQINNFIEFGMRKSSHLPAILLILIGALWTIGCFLFGLIILQKSQECRVSKQYLCQMSSAICGISILALAAVEGFNGLVIFACVYGFSLGSYNYVLKVYTYERVRARHFPRAWSFIQSAQALPLVIGVPLSGFLNSNVNWNWKSGYYLSAIFVFIGSLSLFLTDIRKKTLARRKATNSSMRTSETTETAQSPIIRQLSFTFPTPQVSSPQSNVELSGHSRHSHNEVNDDDDEEVGELLDDKELPSISEEGIADMDFQDVYYDEWVEYLGGDCITSCNKVEVEDCLISEFDPEHPMLQNRSQQKSNRRNRLKKHKNETSKTGSIVSAIAIAGGIAGLSIPTIPEEMSMSSSTENCCQIVDEQSNPPPAAAIT